MFYCRKERWHFCYSHTGVEAYSRGHIELLLAGASSSGADTFHEVDGRIRKEDYHRIQNQTTCLIGESRLDASAGPSTRACISPFCGIHKANNRGYR